MWSMFEILGEEKLVIEILDIGAALSESPSYQPLIDAGRAHVIGFGPNVAECARLNQEYGASHQF